MEDRIANHIKTGTNFSLNQAFSTEGGGSAIEVGLTCQYVGSTASSLLKKSTRP